MDRYISTFHSSLWQDRIGYGGRMYVTWAQTNKHVHESPFPIPLSPPALRNEKGKKIFTLLPFPHPPYPPTLLGHMKGREPHITASRTLRFNALNSSSFSTNRLLNIIARLFQSTPAPSAFPLPNSSSSSSPCPPPVADPSASDPASRVPKKSAEDRRS